MDYKTILENQMRASQNAGGISPEEALEMQELYRKIREIDLGEVVAERVRGMTTLDKMIADLEQAKPMNRKAKPTKVHHHTKRARRRKKDREYYHEVLKPRRSKKKAEELTTPEGWWKHLMFTWKQMGTKVDMSYEEFVEVIYPVSAGAGYVPIFFRYDPKEAISIGNVLIRDSESRKVIFDGKEHLLRLMGVLL